ncbi:hypothetical protein [Nocardia sp. R6R-6]|uniref:hypothetical protein n=1 Tax=Nocardia sp. R6R-6 TaxID=3459303 RepID=UPI00403DF95E
MPTPREVLALDVSGMNGVAEHATHIAEAIIKASNSMHTTINGDLTWQGEARRTAGDKSDREQAQMRAIAVAYDDLSAACAGAARDLEYPIAEIKTIFQYYVATPVAVADDWSISGVDDWNSEAGVQLSRLTGLISALAAADAKWGAEIAAANQELDKMAPAEALTAASTEIQQDKAKDIRADPDRIRTSAAAFQQTFGRPPTSAADWATAEVLNPKSYDPKYQGVAPEIRVVRINPVSDQGVVRVGQYIEQRDVTNPKVDPLRPDRLAERERGDNRTADANFDPEHNRVTTYVDYENGIVVMRQNPSVVQNSDGTPGRVEVAAPDGRVWQNPDGSVRVQYDAANPFAPDIAKDHSTLGSHTVTVNGDLVFTPGANGIEVNGTRTDYPSLEAYQDRPGSPTRTVVIDPAAVGNSFGPGMNLPFHHDVGSRGGDIFQQFNETDSWNLEHDVRVPGGPKPSTPFGPVSSPPTVAHNPVPKGTI